MKKTSQTQQFLLYLSIVLFFIIALPSSIDAQVVNPKQVYSYEQMERDIHRLTELYPNLITYEVIGKSEYGRNIYAVSLGNGVSTSYINGSNHAREWISTNLVMYMIDQYASAYQKGTTLSGYNVKSILDNHTIWFVPMMNPDGVTLQQFGLNAFPRDTHASLIAMNNGSTDFRRWKANGKGIDLNRQFNANWSNIRNDPGRPYFENHKGPAPHHASEVKAVIQFTQRINPEMAVSYHSSGSVLYWHFKQTGQQYQRDLFHARNISNLTGYRLMSNHSTFSGGGYTDWFTDTYKRPAFTPELGTYVGSTHVPLSQFDRIWNENRLVGLYVARESQKIYTNRLQHNIARANLVINDRPYQGDVSALIVYNRTLVPVRGIFEEFGAQVHWDPHLRTVTVKNDDTTVLLRINSNKAYVNGSLVELDVPAQIIQNRTMVPVRFISEALGATVHWNFTTRTAYIIYKKEIPIKETPPVEEKVTIPEQEIIIEEDNTPAEEEITEE